tara:strand:- start:212 stop:493 length:282 start_codon:yes stop_codon:yes gene_type:complete
MNKVKLKIIRKKIDATDQEILGLIKKRTLLVNKVIKIKKLKKQIVDNKRIRNVLNNIRKKSIAKKIDPKITKQIWTSMINSYIKYEKRNFKRK